MNQQILGNTNNYLFIQRNKNTRDFARNLRRLVHIIVLRESIPLDSKLFPDFVGKETMLLMALCRKILVMIQEESSTPEEARPTQLELTFSPSAPVKKARYEKGFPVEWETITRQEFVDERLNDMWIDIVAIHAKYGTKDIIPMKAEVSRCSSYIGMLVEMNDFNLRVNILRLLLVFMEDLINFIDINYPDHKESINAVLIPQKIKIENRINLNSK